MWAVVLSAAISGCSDATRAIPPVSSYFEGLADVELGIPAADLLETRPDLFPGPNGTLRELTPTTEATYAFHPHRGDAPPNAMARLVGVEHASQPSDSSSLEASWRETLIRMGRQVGPPTCYEFRTSGLTARYAQADGADGDVRVAMTSILAREPDGRSHETALITRVERPPSRDTVIAHPEVPCFES